MLVADALRLGGAILGLYPNMLAPQLVSRLLPEIGPNPNVKKLLKQCDETGAQHCALLPLYHCLHTPGGPLKVVYFKNNNKFIIFINGEGSSVSFRFFLHNSLSMAINYQIS